MGVSDIREGERRGGSGGVEDKGKGGRKCGFVRDEGREGEGRKKVCGYEDKNE